VPKKPNKPTFCQKHSFYVDPATGECPGCRSYRLAAQGRKQWTERYDQLTPDERLALADKGRALWSGDE
jgi:hypothetical protein